MKKMKALISFFFALFFTQGYSCAELAAADKLRISYSAVNATQAFLWVAQEKNFFAKHGLEGELLYINSGTMNIAALVGGSVQIAGGGPVSIEARLRGIKLTILGNPLPWLASNLVVHPDIKAIPDLAGKLAGISRFGSSTDQGFRYLFRKNNLNVDRDLKMLQMGGDSSRVAAMKAGTIQYTFLGAAATDSARALGFRVLATAQQMAIPFPWTSVVVDEGWLNRNRELAYRYMKCGTEAIVYLKRNRADSERIISKYMKINDAKLAATEFDFVSSLMPDYITPTLEGTKLILENFGKEYPDAPEARPKGIRRQLDHGPAEKRTVCGRIEVLVISRFEIRARSVTLESSNDERRSDDALRS